MADTKLNLLLAIADIANDDGEAHPGRMRLAKKIRKKERQTKYLLSELVKTPELVIEPMAGPRGTNVYWIPILPGEPGYAPEPCQQPHRCNGNHHPLPEHDQKRTGRKPTPRGAEVIAPPEKSPRKPRKGGAEAIAPQGAEAIAPQGAEAIAPQGAEAIAPEPSGYVRYTSVDVERRHLSAKNGARPEPDPLPFRAAPPAEPLPYARFQLQYHKRHGFNVPSSEVHAAYSDYLYEFNQQREEVTL